MQLGLIGGTEPTTGRTAPPVFTGGIDYVATVGNGAAIANKFTRFSAHATPAAYGAAEGYATMSEAIDALTFVTVGARMPAAGIFEHDGRFYGRKLDNRVTFASGTSWEGVWRLEQHPTDLHLFDGTAPGRLTRVAPLRMVVDGAQRIDLRNVPVDPA